MTYCKYKLRNIDFTGGQNGKDSYTRSVEIVSTDPNLKRQLKDFPYPVESPVALWADEEVLVCGGNVVQSYGGKYTE